MGDEKPGEKGVEGRVLSSDGTEDRPELRGDAGSLQSWDWGWSQMQP